MKKQFVSELELISQLSVPNAVIGPISLRFLQLASLIHCRKWRREGTIGEKSQGEGSGCGVCYMSVGVCRVLESPPPGVKNHFRWGSETVRSIN